MIGIVPWVKTNIDVLMLFVFLIIILVLLSLVVIVRRQGRLRWMVSHLMAGMSEPDAEQALRQLLTKVGSVADRFGELDLRLEQLERQMQRVVQRVGMIRFDAFDDIAGEQSFSLALLDEVGSGVVLTTLFSRSETRTYAKPIVNGGSSRRMTDEEREAIRRAMEGVAETAAPLPG